MRPGRELAALGDDGRRRRSLTDLRAVEDGTSHPYETMVLDLAPVHDRVVAEDASLADDCVGVEDAAVLHVGPGPDTDGLRVAAQHGPVPDARFFTQVTSPITLAPGAIRGRCRRAEAGCPFVQIQRGTYLVLMYSSPNFRSR